MFRVWRQMWQEQRNYNIVRGNLLLTTHGSWMIFQTVNDSTKELVFQANGDYQHKIVKKIMWNAT